MIFGWLFSLLPRQARRILVSTFTESPSKTTGERHAGFTELIAETIGGRQGSLPALAASVFQQISLPALGLERRRVHP
jgi:hypothetical protein